MPGDHDSQLLKGVLGLLLLHLLAEHESYGYEVVQRLHELGLTEVAAGTVYPALSRLEREKRLTRPAGRLERGPGPQVLPADQGRLRRARGRHRPMGVTRRPRVRPAVPPRPRSLERPLTVSHDVNLVDRLRIERVVWSLDQRLYDLPRKTRIARRRELRDNLLAAAHDVGTAAALRDVGDSGTLAAEYVEAELGPGPRHSWIAAGLFLLTASLLLTSVLFDAADAFGDGILAGNPDASGTFTWPGISLLQSEVTFTVADGDHTSTGGAFTPLTWLLLIGGTIAVGRLWRALPIWRRRRAG